MATPKILGIDVGASGIKAAPVNVRTGKLLAERYRIDTPSPPKPQSIAAVIAEIVEHFEWRGSVGCGFPARVKDGIVQTVANLDESWIGTDARALFEGKTKRRFVVLNDADAAGLAEMRLGAGKREEGLVIVLTLGTGIGSAVFHRRKLLPNMQLGEMRVRSRRAGLWASDNARRERHLSWKRWAKRVNKFLGEIERILLPDLIIIGGGASSDHPKFLSRLECCCPIVAAEMLNEAGIVGAALAAKRRER